MSTRDGESTLQAYATSNPNQFERTISAPSHTHAALDRSGDEYRGGEGSSLSSSHLHAASAHPQQMFDGRRSNMPETHSSSTTSERSTELAVADLAD